MSGAAEAYLLIAVLGVATFATRIGGHLILARFGRINRRLEAALDAIPIAVIAALVAPVALATGVAETLGVAVAAMLSLRFPMHVAIFAAVPVVALLRAAGI